MSLNSSQQQTAGSGSHLKKQLSQCCPKVCELTETGQNNLIFAVELSPPQSENIALNTLSNISSGTMLQRTFFKTRVLTS